MQPVQLSSYQAVSLITVIILSTAILFLPANVAQMAGRDAWFSFLLGTLFGILNALLVSALAQKHGGESFQAIIETVLGTVPGKLVGMAYASFFIIWTALVIREFASFMATAFMPLTPISVFIIIFAATCIYSAYSGLEVIARTGEIILPVISFFLLVIMLLQVDLIELETLLPLLRSSPASLMRGAFLFFGWSGQVFTLLLLYPHLERPDHALRVTVISVVIASFFLVTGSIALEVVFQYPLSARLVFALLSFVRIINIAGFLFERIDAVVILIWVAGVFVKVSFLLHITSTTITRLFNLRENRYFLFPLVILTSALSVVMFESSLELEKFINFVWPLLAFPFFAGVPLLLLLLTVLLNKDASTKQKGGGNQ